MSSHYLNQCWLIVKQTLTCLRNKLQWNILLYFSCSGNRNHPSLLAPILMVQCKTAVTPLLTPWSYCSLELNHQYGYSYLLYAYSLADAYSWAADFRLPCPCMFAVFSILCCDDFRTGARTKFGLLKDGYNSAIRYMLNNFKDGFKQVVYTKMCVMRIVGLFLHPFWLNCYVLTHCSLVTPYGFIDHHLFR